jgi:hypothetical protein
LEIGFELVFASLWRDLGDRTALRVFQEYVFRVGRRRVEGTVKFGEAFCLRDFARGGRDRRATPQGAARIEDALLKRRKVLRVPHHDRRQRTACDRRDGVFGGRGVDALPDPLGAVENRVGGFHVRLVIDRNGGFPAEAFEERLRAQVRPLNLVRVDEYFGAIDGALGVDGLGVEDPHQGHQLVSVLCEECIRDRIPLRPRVLPSGKFGWAAHAMPGDDHAENRVRNVRRLGVDIGRGDSPALAQKRHRRDNQSACKRRAGASLSTRKRVRAVHVRS